MNQIWAWLESDQGIIIIIAIAVLSCAVVILDVWWRARGGK